MGKDKVVEKKKRRGKTIEVAGCVLGRKATVGCVKSHFLDSGAFSLWVRAKAHAQKHNVPPERFYTRPGADGRFSKRFLKYLDEYAAFVKEYAAGIDLYANVDVIGNPNLTWESQIYLEREHGLTPVPVVHYRTEMTWLHHYLDKGYDIIGLGGLVGASNPLPWLDRCFCIICDTPNKLPRTKIHGFGVTGARILRRYPWWSVDSTSWAQAGSNGAIIVPYKTKRGFVFDDENKPPYQMYVSHASSLAKKKGMHFYSITKEEQNIILEWLEYINVPLGKMKGEEIIEYGVTNHHSARRIANLRYFKMLEASLPEWPWPFVRRQRRGFF